MVPLPGLEQTRHANIKFEGVVCLVWVSLYDLTLECNYGFRTL